MFGIFKKKQPTQMDAVIQAIYGNNPPSKSADLERAITIAHEDLLAEQVPISDVQRVAEGLFAGPMPYSTHDLAVAVAMSFFKTPSLIGVLNDIQIGARLRVLNWMKGGKVAPGVLKIFEDTLYQLYKPNADVRSSPPPVPTPPPLPEPTEEYTGDIADGFRFTAAAQVWFDTSGEIGRLKAACKANGIEVEHARAVAAVLEADNCIMKLMRVRDYNEMLEEENRLVEVTKRLVSAMELFSEAADVRQLDVSASSAIVISLAEVLRTRGML